MTTRAFAMTYPQLMNQALEQGWDESSMLRLRAGYDFAEQAFAGFYRAQGAPFIGHVVRSASIVLVERQSATVVLATLLHAVYMLHTFDGRRYRRPSDEYRQRIQREFGEGVESLIQQFDRLPWFSRTALECHLQDLDKYPEVTRQVLLMRLANELEDYLDLAMVYRGAYPYRERLESYGEQMVELAIRLGRVELADELRESFRATLESRLPASVVRQRRNAYTMSSGRWLRKTVAQRAKTETRRVVKRFLLKGAS